MKINHLLKINLIKNSIPKKHKINKILQKKKYVKASNPMTIKVV